MSLILEALKKLERDKQAPDRGFLVVAHVPWATGSPSRSWWLGLTAMLGIAGILITLLLLRGREERPAPAPAPPTLAAAPSSTRTTPLAATPLLPPAAVPAPSSTPSPSPTGEVELRLNAITQQEGRPVAVLNDRVVREGDIFDGIHVIRIGEAEVEVEVNGKRRIVRF